MVIWHQLAIGATGKQIALAIQHMIHFTKLNFPFWCFPKILWFNTKFKVDFFHNLCDHNLVRNFVQLNWNLLWSDWCFLLFEQNIFGTIKQAFSWSMHRLYNLLIGIKINRKQNTWTESKMHKELLGSGFEKLNMSEKKWLSGMIVDILIPVSIWMKCFVAFWCDWWCGETSLGQVVYFQAPYWQNDSWKQQFEFDHDKELNASESCHMKTLLKASKNMPLWLEMIFLKMVPKIFHFWLNLKWFWI